MDKKLVYIVGALAGGCASSQVPVHRIYKWDNEKSIAAIVEEPNTAIESHVLVSSDKPIDDNTLYVNITSYSLLGAAGLCLAAAAYLKLRQGKGKKKFGKKSGLIRINLLPPEHRAGRLRKAIRFLYSKLPKRELEDYPMPGYSNEGWGNFGDESKGVENGKSEQ